MEVRGVAFGLLNLSIMLTSCAATGPTAQNLGAVGSMFRDYANCPEMVIVPAGRFVMGTAESEPIRDKEGPSASSPRAGKTPIFLKRTPTRYRVLAGLTRRPTAP